MQTTVFTDGFQELKAGDKPFEGPASPAIHFDPRYGSLGKWMVASTLRQEGFNGAWTIGNDGERNFLAQNFTNLDEKNTPLSLISHPLIVAGDSLWSDYTIDVDFTPLVRFDKCGVVFKYKNPADYLFFGIEGNTVILKQIEQSVTPLRPIERILDIKPLVWHPGEKVHATITVRRNKVSTILNDSIRMHADNLPAHRGKIGLLSDLPARFHRVEVKVLRGEQRKLARRKRQLTRKNELLLGDHPLMVRWKMFNAGENRFGLNIRLGDLTSDGNKEIVVALPSASGTGIASVAAMTLEGEWLWHFGSTRGSPSCLEQELPVEIHDLDGDGTREIIFVRKGRIYILKGKDGKVVKRVTIPGPKINVASLTFGDLMGVERDNCILLSDRKQRLMAFNEKLGLLWDRTTDTGTQPVTDDLDGDGRDEVLMGYAIFDPEGNLVYDLTKQTGDRCNGVLVTRITQGDREIPSLVYAAGDWGLLYFNFAGTLIRQHIMGHVRYMGTADFESEIPGLEIITSSQWGCDGLIHVLDATGSIINNFSPFPAVSRCVPVNWKGDGEEFLMISADSVVGGMYNAYGQLAVAFPPDGHPVSHYLVQDLTGDARDEVIVWNSDKLWIYTQEDNPRMGNTYAPSRIPLYNFSMYQMSCSLPAW